MALIWVNFQNKFLKIQFHEIFSSDIEEGAGDADNAGINLVHFVNKLRTLQPEIIIGQPTYGYPQGNKIFNFTKFSQKLIFFLSN